MSARAAGCSGLGAALQRREQRWRSRTPRLASQVARCRGGGPTVIPDTELHPLARTRIFQALVKQEEPLLLENFQTHIKQAQGISETHREDLLAMDALTWRAMECKVVCTVANFRGHKVTNWRQQTMPDWQGLSSYDTCWRLRKKRKRGQTA